MTNQKTQELIDLMVDQAELEEICGYKEGTEDYRDSQIRIFNYNEIKERLEGQGRIETSKSILDIAYTLQSIGVTKSTLHGVNMLLSAIQPRMFKPGPVGDEKVEKALYECLDFISGLPIKQVSSVKKLKWVNAFRKLLTDSKPRITRGEISGIVKAIKRCEIPYNEDCSGCSYQLRVLLKSKNIKVVE